MRLTERIQSRKFLLALGACVYFGLMGAMDNLAQIVVAYLAVQAAQDAISDWQASKTQAPGPEGE